MLLGEFIKQIRIQKGISQAEASANAITQSNYSKFELGKIDISANALFTIIYNLDISLEEFVMLYENEFSTEMNEIVNHFFKMRSNKIEDLIHIRESASDYLARTNNYNETLQNIIELTYGLEAISENQDYEKAIFYANPIWDKLQKRERWYLREITLLNTILYIFPFETAEEIIKRSLKFLSNYPDNTSIKILKLNLLINISLLCIKNEKIKLAITYLNHSLSLANQLPIEFYKNLVKMRLAYCNASLKDNFDHDFMSIIMYFYSSNNTDMFLHLKREANQYCKNPLFMELIEKYEQKLKSIL